MRSLPALLLLSTLFSSPAHAAEPAELVLWHTYGGTEQKALDATVASFNAARQGRIHLTTLPIPYDVMADKLTAAIALGTGPDLFVFAHDRLGDWAAQGLVEPLQYWMDDETMSRFSKTSLVGLTYPQKSRNLYGLPMAVKSVALVYDASRISKPPTTLEELKALAREHTGNGSYGLVFDWANTYTEAGFLHAFGGGILDDGGKPIIDSPANVAAITWVKALREEGLLPKEITGALVGSLFNDRKAAMIVTGPWALGDFKKDLDYRVALLPSGPAGPILPFASIEGLIMSSRTAHKAESFEAMEFLTSDLSASIRRKGAGQPVPNVAVWEGVSADKAGAAQAALLGFHHQSSNASTPMPSAPAMRHVWTPMDAALSRAFAPGITPQEALTEAQRRVLASIEAAGEDGNDNAVTPADGLIASLRKQSEKPDDPRPVVEGMRTAVLRRFAREGSAVGSWLVDGEGRWAIAGTTRAKKTLSDLADRVGQQQAPLVSFSHDQRTVSVALRMEDGRILVGEQDLGAAGTSPWLFALGGVLALLAALAFIYRATLAPHLGAYAYILPACLALIVLIFIPFTYGLSLGFYDVSPTRERFVGMKNFTDILLLRNKGDAHSFYFTFAMTVAWTLINVTLHLVVGLALALLLQDPQLRFKRIYRVLLIVPWAIPNYITALIWKAMFNAEYGLVNRALGLGTFSWFERPWTAFAANLVTNVWLGFPFMMVTALGALQSIPKELYEAADVDGAGRWTKFRSVTLPLLKPALFPAVILGTIWTFNLSFNVIYLVSGGAPDGATDILVTQAFRYAFEQYRYGYAAAYATLIFGILLGYTMLTNRITKATEGAFE